MPSEQMRNEIEGFHERRAAGAAGPRPSLAEVRANFAPAGRPYPLPDDVQTTATSAAGVPAHWLSTPGADPSRVVLFIHGGGYQLGSLSSHGELAARIGRATGTRVLFPEYRLAPENPFPAAIDDILAVWRWLRTDQAIPATSIALAGDSSGAGLAVALLTLLRDADEDLPVAAALLSPLVDLTNSAASIRERVDEDPIFTPAMLEGVSTAYLSGTDPRTPLASPLFAPLSGLPPLLIQVGTAELLLSDAERLAEAASTTGVETTLHIGQGLPHVYQLMAHTPEAAEAVTTIATFLRKHLT